MLYAGYRVVCVRTVSGLCVNALRRIPRCMHSERFSRDDTVTVLRMFCPVVRLPGRLGTVYRDV
jgi:hypothetical protein